MFDPIDSQPLHLFIAKTVRRMVVDHPGGLHVRIDDGRPDEVEAAAFEVPGDFIGQGVSAGIPEPCCQAFCMGVPSTKSQI